MNSQEVSDYRRSMQALVSKPLRHMAPGTRTADENLHKIGNIVLPLELNGFHPIVAVFLSTPHNSQALPIIIPDALDILNADGAGSATR